MAYHHDRLFYNEFEVFFPSSDKLVSAWSGLDIKKQIKFMELCLRSITEAHQDLMQGNKTLFDLFEFLAQQRKLIAINLKQDHINELGTLRNGESFTYITKNAANRYSDQYSGLEKIFNANKQDDIIVIKNPLDYNSEFSKITMKNNELAIHHTNITDSYYLEGMFDKIEESTFPSCIFLRNGISDVDLYKNLGKIAWILAQLMPCQRGSCAISDMVIKTLLKYHGRPLYPFKAGLSWDLQAIFQPDMDAFANDYINLFAMSETEIKNFMYRVMSSVRTRANSY